MLERPPTLLAPPATAAPIGPPPKQAVEAGKPQGRSFGEVMRAIGEETKRGEELMKRATCAGSIGRDLSAGELLALQAGVYRYVEVVDLASKLVDRVAQSAKSVLQSGGQ